LDLRPEHICIQEGPTGEEDYYILGMTWFRAYHVLVNLKTNVVSFPTYIQGKIVTGPMVQIQGFASRVQKSGAARHVSWADEEISEIFAVRLKERNNYDSQICMVNSAASLTSYYEDVVGGTDSDTSIHCNSEDDNSKSSEPMPLDEALTKVKNTMVNDVIDSTSDSIKKLDFELVPNFLKALLKSYEECFVEVSGLGRLKNAEHHIKIKEGEQPVKCKPFRLTWEEQRQMSAEIQELLSLNLIRPSHGTWSSPCFFIRKKTGELRLVIDYRKLNAKTVDDKYVPLPNIEDLLDSLGGAKFFTTLDAASGYYQIPMSQDSIEKTGFVTGHGGQCYEFVVMSFGQKLAPFTYQDAMNRLFKDYLGVFLYIFIDDIIIFSKNQEEHMNHIKLILDRCWDAGLRLKWKKCHWGTTTGVEFLGHVVSGQGLLPNNANVEKVLKFPPCTDDSSVRSFLGLVNFYARFLPNYAAISDPLHKLLKKNCTFVWGKDQQVAFINSK
jgi:hypothetical protein